MHNGRGLCIVDITNIEFKKWRDSVDIFKRNKKQLPDLITDEELMGSPVDYNTVVDYLIGLSDGDYDKVCKVANVYRNAHKDACAVLGVENEPTSFINPPEPPEEPEQPGSFLDEPDFLEDDLPAPKSKKKIKVKD